tara:strand:- start:93 stop:683 length:591 start_codon:yes stop_codon:yes gene_type:complete
MKKKLLLISILSLFIGCSTTNLRTFDVDASLTNPSEYTIAVFPCKAVDNPDITTEPRLTQKFESGLRKIGFKVIDAYFVNETMVELGINSEEELSLIDMKKLQKELNCSAFSLITITYGFKSETSSVEDILYGTTEAKNSQGKYHPIAETLIIIDPSSFTTLVSIRKSSVAGRSISDDIITLLDEHFNKPESTQSK